MEHCNECYFYEANDVERGLCHRYPPDNGITKVKANWWCGEWWDANETEYDQSKLYQREEVIVYQKADVPDDVVDVKIDKIKDVGGKKNGKKTAIRKKI